MSQVADPRPVLREWTRNRDQFRLLPIEKIKGYEIQRFCDTDGEWERWELIDCETAALVRELLEEK